MDGYYDLFWIHQKCFIWIPLLNASDIIVMKYQKYNQLSGK